MYRYCIIIVIGGYKAFKNNNGGEKKLAKAEQKQKKKKSITSIALKVAVAVLGVYLLVSFVDGQMKVASMQAQQNTVQAQIDAKAAENEELSEILESGDDNAYIERIARQKLGYAWPDEKVYIDITQN